MSIDTKSDWETYCTQEIAILQPLLKTYGFVLEELQPHISGERFLMQAVTTSSGKKLILLGHDDKKNKVVIKATKDASGIDELIHERNCREILKKIDFAGEVFNTPEEVAFIKHGTYVITVQRFIEQPHSFLERPLQEQFSLALRTFKGQESAHATTFKHHKLIRSTFDIRDKNTYLNTFDTFRENIVRAFPESVEIDTLLHEAKKILSDNQEIIEQYSGFLTHTDFVPHNIRISSDNTIYLLDHSSLTFGNKYEGWARFINFMTLYNPELQRALETYVRKNRTIEESVSLRMMRIYRLGEIIYYYVKTLPKSSGRLLELNTARVHFWKEVLSSVLKEEEISTKVIQAYTITRDNLRSDDEKRRQQGLH